MTHDVEKPVFKNKKEKIQWFLDEIDSYKEDMGKWYTIFIRRIIPFLVLFIPLILISFRFYCFVADKYLGGVFSSADSTPGIVVWLIAMLFFLVILIFLPRFATFCEFVLAGVYYYLVVSLGTLVDTGLGYFVLISVSVFMFMKLVFFVLEIMYRIVFRGEKEPKAYPTDDDVVF